MPGGHGPFGATLLADFLSALFVSSLVGTVVGMLPLRFLPGGDLAGWSRRVWVIVFGVALFGMLQVMLRPVSHSKVGQAPIVTVIVLLVFFGGGSLVFHRHFSRRKVGIGASGPLTGGETSSAEVEPVAK